MSGKVALITGITGQDGSYLTEFLLKKGYTVRSPMDDVLDDYIVIHDTGAGLCANMDISPGVRVEMA